MEELLREWDLECLTPTFIQNDINIENMLELDDGLIKELIPSVGLRIKFVKKYNELKINQNVIDINSLPVIISNNDDVQPAPSPSTSDLMSSTNSEVIIVPTVNRGVAFCGLDDSLLMLQDDKMPEFDLKTLLSIAPYGSLILKYYKDHEMLNDYMRNKLVDLIIRNLYSYIMKYNLTHQQYNILTSKIIQCFPNECHGKYYQSGHRMGHAIQAKGKLVDKVKNLRYHSPDKVYLRKRKNASLETQSQPKTPKVATDVLDEKYAITWLKFNREPWDEVIKLWKLTYNFRREFDCHQTVSEFITEWPIIGDPRAESLVESDFTRLYPGKELLLLSNWQDFFNKIVLSKKHDLKENKDPSLSELLIYLQDNENLSEDSKTAIQLSALPRLVPPKGRIKVAKSHWKFSTLESLEALIIHCQNPGDINLKIDQQIEKASKRKILSQVQPYLLVQGESLTNIKNTYIVIDKIHCKCESTLKGVDLLFKMFHVLQIQYPCQAEHIWMLVQKAIFKINNDNDKLIPYIEDILKQFP